MAKDSLAQGARSATFSAGHAEKDEPIEFHGTVAAEENPIAAGLQRLEQHAAEEKEAEAAKDFSRYQPMNERVLIRRIKEKQGLILQPEAYRQQSPKGVIVCASEDAFPLAAGDVVFFGEYNAEPITVEGEELHLVNIADLRMKILPA